MTDRTVSHYRILEPLGEGGMGQVYKAEDTKLKRTVALKFLPKDVTGTGEEAERFQREAEAAATLDHPNICAIYEINEEGGETFLAMPYLEGEPLDVRIQRGPVPLDQVYEIAKQAAEGLAAAHSAGVVHRDIKPSNIMLSEDRSGRLRVKLMDFGVAQISGASKLTNVRSRVGTVAYMSPEQSLGEEVGLRSDLWSLGVVIYEAVTGDLPFKGHYEQAIVYAALNEEPVPLTDLRSRVPMELEWIVEKCLAKSPADRYQDARELVVDLEMLQRRSASGRTAIQPIGRSGATGAEPVSGADGPARAPGPVPSVSRSVPQAAGDAAPARKGWAARLALAGALLLGFAVGAYVPGREPAGDPTTLWRFTVRPVEAVEGDQTIGSSAISSNGRIIAFSTTGSDGSIWLQPLDRLDPAKVDGTRGARTVFWSPSSEFVGFTTGRGIGKVALRGNTVTMLVEDAGSPLSSAAWSADGQSILYAPRGGPPMRIGALGGVPRPLFEGVPARRAIVSDLSSISFADGVETVLYSERAMDGDTVIAIRVSDGVVEQAVQVVEGHSASYSRTGHVLFQPSSMTSALWALPFDPRTLETGGEPFLVAQNASRPSVSADGTLVYLDDPESQSRQLVWLDRAGERVGLIGRPQPWVFVPRVSPAGDRVLAFGGANRNFDLWVHEAERPVMNRVTFDNAEEDAAVWSPDGARIAVSHRGSSELKLLPIGGGAATSIFTSESGSVEPLDWSRDGRYILIRKRVRADRESSEGGALGSRVPLKGAGGFGPRAGIGYLERPAGEGPWQSSDFVPPGPFFLNNAVFSPNGRYVAYESNESGQFEVYVRPFPDGEQRWQITTEGGTLPRWSRDGRELYYVLDDTLNAVAVETRDEFRPGAIEPLFTRIGLFGFRGFKTYDVGTDGRFAVVGYADSAPDPSIRIVLDWFAEFRESQGG